MSASGNPSPIRDDYTIGWICALPVELSMAEGILDCTHPGLPQPSTDPNSYCLGSVGKHNIVIACLPAGVIGTTSAARVAMRMGSTFPNIRFGLMVGIGGGVPTLKNDVRLGDVVVSKPTDTSGGVIPYDMKKTLPNDHFERNGSLNKPPTVLLQALSRIQSKHRREGPSFLEHVQTLKETYPMMQADVTYPGAELDVLFESTFHHPVDQDTCAKCNNPFRTIRRPARNDTFPKIHYGTIASGNQVMKDGVTRDELRQELDLLCFEMEAAGLMDDFPCLVVRGICDYSDSHKNKRWQPYAAAIAAAYAKELLSLVPKSDVESTTTVERVMAESKSNP